MRVNHFRLRHRNNVFLFLGILYLSTNLIKIGRDGSAIMDTSLKTRQIGSKLTRMRVCYTSKFINRLVRYHICDIQIWGRSDENRGRIEMFSRYTDTKTHTERVFVQCHAMHWTDKTAFVNV